MEGSRQIHLSGFFFTGKKRRPQELLCKVEIVLSHTDDVLAKCYLHFDHQFAHHIYPSAEGDLRHPAYFIFKCQ